MAYVDRVLLGHERIERRPSLSRMATYGAPTLEFLAIVIVWTTLRMIAAPYVAEMTADDPLIGQIFWWTYIVGVGLFTARFLWRMGRRALELWFTEIAVSNLRFMEKSGVLDISFYSTDLEKIVRVAIEQSLLGRFFNYGDVTIVTVGEVSHTTRNVADPIGLQQALHTRMSESAAPPRRADGEEGPPLRLIRPGAA